MSGISSGIGLISGIDVAGLIDQLMAIESQPVANLQERIQGLDLRRTAWLELSAQLLGLKAASAPFDNTNFFQKFNASSTNESILTATVDENAIPSARTFRVRSLATSHSLVSRGFGTANASLGRVGTLAVEVGHGRVDQSTELSILNGGDGVSRGTISVTDRAGNTAKIDLTGAITVDDVLDAINRETTLNVRARVTSLPFGDLQGDRMVIEDLTPDSAIAGNLIITDESGGSAAADLGIVANVAAGRIDGHDLVRLTFSTPLSILNDGNGVDAGGVVNNDLLFTKGGGVAPESFTVSLSDTLRLETDLRALNSGGGVRLGIIRITDRTGASVDVDLTDFDLQAGVTIGDIRDRLTQEIEAAGVQVSVTPVNSRLQLTDTSGAQGETAQNLKVEDLSGFAAADLGIAGDVEKDNIQGRDVYQVATVGDVINAVNFAAGNKGRIVEASLSADGNALVLQAREFDTTVTVTAQGSSAAARDLGLEDARFGFFDGPFETRQLIGGLNTVLLQSLNGGNGLALGEVRFTDRLGHSVTIDFNDPEMRPRTLQDVVDLINADSTTALTAAVNAAGTGIEIRDESGGSGPIAVTDLGGGTFAAELGIAGSFDVSAGSVINSGNLQLQYVSRQTRLADLNAGRGVPPGDFSITDSTGAHYIVSLAKNFETVGDVIDAITKAVPDTIEARINDTGDGIVIIDRTDGSSTLTIEDLDGGQSAANLRLAGTAVEGTSLIDGSFETHVDVGPSDTLEDIARKLDEAHAGLSASVIHNGGNSNPFGLMITAAETGHRGQLVIDSGGLDLGLTTVAQAQDAVLSIGDGSSGSPLLIVSSTNTVDGVLEGVTLNLLSAADEDVTVTVSQDIDAIVKQVQQFVDSYNGVQATIDDATSFDPETFERGPLFGDATVDLIRSRLRRTITREFDGVDPSVSRLFAVGVRMGADYRLEFDEQRFRDAYQKSPESVEQLFTAAEAGFGDVLEETLDELTRDFDGVIARRESLLTDQQDLLNDRIDQLNVILAAKRVRLEAQFTALESALAMLQDQQNALTSLTQLANGTTS